MRSLQWAAHDVCSALPLALDRASFAHLIVNASACDLDHIAVAIERADHHDAAVRALARARLGLASPCELLADILVGVERVEVFLALARQMTGESVFAMLRRGRFGDDLLGVQTACAAFALWQLHPTDVARPLVTRLLRHVSRQPWLCARPGGLVEWLIAQLADPNLTAIYERRHRAVAGRGAATAGQLAMYLWSAPIDDVVAFLPERAHAPLPLDAATRIAQKVGRNESCPCGSGRKYKRCCSDRPASGSRSQPCRAELLRTLEPRLECSQIGELSYADLARLDLTRLRGDTVLAVAARQSELRDWPRARCAIDEIARRRGKAVADQHLQDVIYQATRARQYDVAARLLSQLAEPDLAPDLALEVALAARGPDVVAQLEGAALVAVRGDGRLTAIDLACAVLRTLPALGILVARGALLMSGGDGREVLLDAIHEARDDLGLPPDDPVHEMTAAPGGEQDQAAPEHGESVRAHLTRATADLRTGINHAAARLAALERQVAEQERQLDRARRIAAAPGCATQPSAGEPQNHALREKIDELQALLRARNAERAELRRRLVEATSGNAGAQPSLSREDHLADRGDDALEDLPPRIEARPVLLPRFGAAAATSFETVPRNVAAIAMRTIGALAAGDVAAWRAAKQAKGTPRQVLIARAGIHHRLLFRTDDGALEVLELVTRGSLPTTLKRLRSTERLARCDRP